MDFNKKLTLNGNPSLIPQIAERIRDVFQADGYEVSVQELYNGGVDISLSKGGVFKMILGMKTALKVTMLPQGNLIDFDAKVGIFEQQVIPTVIMLFIMWPVVLTQIWGLIKQSQLDDNVLAVANQVILENPSMGGCPPPPPFEASPSDVEADAFVSSPINGEADVRFCTECGAVVASDASFCPSCGYKL